MVIGRKFLNNLNNEINGEITSEEIVSCVKNLKNDKASGDDFIVNEYIKSSIDIILPVYIKMFNCKYLLVKYVDDIIVLSPSFLN
jgi:hypothetical protein